MEKPTRAHRLLSLVLVLALVLGAAAPLVRCAPAAAAASHHDGSAPCSAPCCALRAPGPGSDASVALPLAERDRARPDATPMPRAQPGPALVFPTAAPLLPAEGAPAPRDATHGPPPVVLPVRLHVFLAAFLN